MAEASTSATIGWDVGGAHVKAVRLQRGEVVDAVQWSCPLWQGLQHLEAVLAAARERWPDLARTAAAVTMTGEMVDCFAHREEGVARIAEVLAKALGAPRFFGGDAGWLGAEAVPAHWRAVASANWLATARHAAAAFAGRAGVLVDIGSTTTDLIAFDAGRVLTPARSDADRLATSELVYLGVARTPLCALARRIRWRGRELNVMNEFFATTADIYRLTGELDPRHDAHPAADGGAKTPAATHARLARMIGLDGRDADGAEWLEFARRWREAELAQWREAFAQVAALHGLAGRAGGVVVAAGCGAFVVPELAPPQWDVARYGRDVARAADPALAAWVDVCAPAAAVAALHEQEQRRCGS